jgi:hypothetical protein
MKCFLHTSEDGLQSIRNTKKEVSVYGLSIDSIHNTPGEDGDGFADLMVYFHVKTWDTRKEGLIWGDDLFIKELKEELKKIGFSQEAVNHIYWAESGLQGRNYATFETINPFAKEYLELKPGGFADPIYFEDCCA